MSSDLAQTQTVGKPKRSGCTWLMGIVALFAICVSASLGVYILVDKGIVDVSINFLGKEGVEEVGIDDAQVENNLDEDVVKGEDSEMAEAVRRYGDLAYMDNGEIFLMYYDGSNLKQLTHTDGKVSGFRISPDNTRVIYSVSEIIQLPEEYILYYEDLKGQDRSTMLFSEHKYDTSLFEINIETEEVQLLLDRLQNENYFADMLLAAVEETYDYFAGIDAYNYHSNGKDIVFARDNDIRYSHEQKDFTKLDNATFILNIAKDELSVIPNFYYAYSSFWSDSGNYLILYVEEMTAMDWGLYDANDLQHVELIEKIDSALYGHRYTFKGNQDIAIEHGGIQVAGSPRKEIYREIDLETYEVDLDMSNDLENVNEIVLLNSQDSTIFSQSETYAFRRPFEKKYIHIDENGQTVLFNQENSEFGDPSYHIVYADIEILLNLDLKEPQLVGVIEDVFFSDGVDTVLRVYDFFDESEPFEILISQDIQKNLPKFEFFVDESSVSVEYSD